MMNIEQGMMNVEVKKARTVTSSFDIPCSSFIISFPLSHYNLSCQYTHHLLLIR